MERNLQPHTGKRGGYKDEEKKMEEDTKGGSSNVPKNEKNKKYDHCITLAEAYCIQVNHHIQLISRGKRVL